MELGAERDVPEAGPGAGIGVHERRPEPAATEDHLEPDEDGRDGECRDVDGDEPPPMDDAGLHGEDEQDDRRPEQQGQRVVADR